MQHPPIEGVSPHSGEANMPGRGGVIFARDPCKAMIPAHMMSHTRPRRLPAVTGKISFIKRPILPVLIGLLLANAVSAAPKEPPRYTLSIGMDLPLEEALQELARQTGLQILFFSDIAVGRRSPALSGEYTLKTALTRLLAGSDLIFRQVNDETVEVRQAPLKPERTPRKVPPTQPASDGPLEEMTVIATAEQLVATRVPTPLAEIPQTMSVISSEQIHQQNLFDLAEAMNNTPGIAVRTQDSLDNTVYSRGFAITSYHVDGGSALKPQINIFQLYYGANPDLSEYDHIEVLRGSDALFSSNSNPGGTVSLVRKRPLSTPSLELSATVGSWNRERIDLDATGPLTEDGALRARAGLVYAKQDYFFDQAHLNRKKVFASLAYDITPTSTLTLGGGYQWDDTLPLFTQIPTYEDGSSLALPINTSLTFPWSFYNTRIAQAYLEYRQQLADAWALTVNSSARRTILDFGYGQFSNSVVVPISLYLGSPSANFTVRPATDALGTLDVTLTGTLDLFGLRERLALGADILRAQEHQDHVAYLFFGPALFNPAAFDPQRYPDPRIAGTSALLVAEEKTRSVLEQYGGFVSLQVELTHRFSVSAGVRIASDSNQTGFRDGAPGTALDSDGSAGGRDSHIVQPYGALLYRFAKHYSWYASVADIYAAQLPVIEYQRADGSVIGPQHGITFESGIKGVWREGLLNGYLALYRVEQRDVPIFAMAGTVGGCCYTTGVARSRGIELGLDGELAPDWHIGSGYSYNLFATGTPEFPSDSTPRHLLKIWTSAKLTGRLARWTIGGDLRGQTGAPPGGPIYRCDAQGQNCASGGLVTIHPYAVVDMRAGYQLNSNWQIALSVNNTLDKRYYQSQNSPSFTLWYGEPRNVMLRVDAKY